MDSFNWLSEGYSPLPVNPNSVQLIRTPTEYYEKLKHGIKTAKKRVVLSTLYLGTGNLEEALVDNIIHALDNNPGIRIGILLDYLRGTRGGSSSSASLLSRIADNAEVYFYHTPDLRGYMKYLLAERTNEIVGLQHMKFYIFDDSILISGANLSDLYFTHRQDRYVFIENCPALADFFCDVFDAVTSFSFRLDSSGKLELNSKCHIDPINGSDSDFRTAFRSRITEVQRRLEKQSKLLIATSSSDTLVFPFLQFGMYDIRDEENILLRLFSYPNNDFTLTMASGYFNLFDRYSETILHKSSYPMDIILASPQANGFFNGNGLSGYIPSLYVHASELFYKQTKRLNKEINLFEYNRPDWTFHAKGYRSVNRDLEAQVLLVTTNDALKEKLSKEKQYLMEFISKIETATFMKRDHYVPYWVKIFSRYFKHFF
uniref:CDP-diacylglycerol--glycerol-3-phosphate 3-phosphatidyltransferase n=1 Tax=Acrobeloides nanus TaxID=290746 RepID=A0A914CBK0_9BILA